MIIITSQNPEYRIHATVGTYELGPQSTDEAVTLVLKTAGIPDLSGQSVRENAQPVVLTLPCLALAITQAGGSSNKVNAHWRAIAGYMSASEKSCQSRRLSKAGTTTIYSLYNVEGVMADD